MTMSDDDRALAAEYVAGLLDPAAQAWAERRLSSNRAFASEVEQWRMRLSELDDAAAPLPLDEEVWERIDKATRAPVAHTAADASQSWQEFWHSLNAWRTATAFASVLAAIFAVTTLFAVQFAREESARKPVYVAILVDDASREAGAVVNAFADGRVEMIPLTEINVPPGRALEIWTLWDREVGPRSVGLIDRARSTILNLEKLPPTAENQLFEITLEPAGGSPIGRPTGPILYKGTTARAL
jgi:anti-sigma-K factor RskA